MQITPNLISTDHNGDSRVVNLPAKFQLDRTRNDHWSELLIPTGRSFPESTFLSLFSSGQSSSLSLSLSHVLSLSNSISRALSPSCACECRWGEERETKGEEKMKKGGEMGVVSWDEGRKRKEENKW